MSIDAGGLAQMTYNHNSFNGGIGLPTSGFASRGKQTNVKRLSVATAKTGVEEPSVSTPRTARGHLLAGLRTSKSGALPPASAPPTQLTQPGLENSYYAPKYQQQEPPKTAVNGSFGNNYGQSNGRRSHMYTPSQVLAPPSIEIGDAGDYSQMDPEVYDELVRTNQYLAEQQLRLQQQLINVQSQFRNLSVGQQYAQPNQMSMYQQQLQQGLQPIVTPVPNQPGVYLVYNQMTGQTSYYVDPAAQEQLLAEQQYVTGMQLSASPPPPTPTFRAEVSPPEEQQQPVKETSPKNMNNPWRSSPPPKSTTPPQDNHTPLPPPSANAFRPGHRKNNLSLANMNGTATDNGPRTGGIRSAGFPVTPMTGTFGPGGAREGEHPIRQPRGPPSLDELIAKPTSKHEGSKNFATRQRRRALHSLVRAGAERRTSNREDFGTPTSEHEITFSVSDTDSIRSGSASLSGKPSLGNIKANAGAIGSERASLKDRSRERGSMDSYTASSVSSEDSYSAGGKLVEIKAENIEEGNKRKGALGVLAANAERRRSVLY